MEKLTIIITGSAGFIGFHLAERLLQQGHTVIGIDAVTDYYDPNLKIARLNILRKYVNFFNKKMLLEGPEFQEIHKEFPKIDIIVHLAAQAGVRYSIENPHTYVSSNLVGTHSVLELARIHSVDHLLMASTSSVYGANTEMPFNERQKTDHQLSFYAATKKSNEVMAHSYSHVFNIPTTMFRFFTVYGPWGRPDMALYKFANNMIKGIPIDVYNNGEMERDFTYVADLVKSISLLIGCKPQKDKVVGRQDSLSPVAPFRVVNIGNSNPVQLMAYIDELENALNIKAKKNMLPMQVGDVKSTNADTTLLKDLTGFIPDTDIKVGVSEFVKWFLNDRNEV